jgi:drug/metabolite transporter (DMT)-like permease
VEAAGILIASVGMVFLTFPPNGFEMNRGDLLSLLCAVTFALHIVLIGHFSCMAGFETIAVIQVTTAAVLALGLFRFVEPVRLSFTSGLAVSVLVTGLLATALAFSTQAWAQQYTSPTRAALIFALEPVVAWVVSYALAGEMLSSRGKVGAGLITAGVLLVELKRTKSEKHHINSELRADV